MSIRIPPPASFDDFDEIQSTLPRVNRDGYDVIKEYVLVDWARSFVNVSDAIEKEQVFYVKAGSWRITAGSYNYRSKPDHPIFIYTVQGKFPASMVGLGAPGSDPNAPTPEYKPQEAATIAMDAVTGSPFYWNSEYLKDITPELIQAEYNEVLDFVARIETEINAPDVFITMPPSTIP